MGIDSVKVILATAACSTTSVLHSLKAGVKYKMCATVDPGKDAAGKALPKDLYGVQFYADSTKIGAVVKTNTAGVATVNYAFIGRGVAHCMRAKIVSNRSGVAYDGSWSTIPFNVYIQPVPCPKCPKPGVDWVTAGVSFLGGIALGGLFFVKRKKKVV